VCDRTPPVISQPPNVPCVEATSSLGAVVTYSLPTVSDAADPAVVVTCLKVSGTTFPVGISTITCSATDASGNKAITVTFTIQVCDRTPPVLVSVPNDIPCVEATSAAGAVVTFTAPSSSDIVDGAVPVVCTPASGSTFSVGTTTVVCTATDANLNVASASFTIQVCDSTPPVITNTPTNIPCVEATSPQGAVVTYTLPTAFDIVDHAVAVSCVRFSGRIFPIGTSTVVCTAVDAHGNSASTSFTVQVCDTVPPTITGTPTDIPCVEATSAAGAVVTYTPPTADDVVDGDVTVTCVAASGSTFPLGQNLVICTAVDATGNSASTAFTIDVSHVMFCFLLFVMSLILSCLPL
jgi:hypothetical protein